MSQRLLDALDELDVVGFPLLPRRPPHALGRPIVGYHLLHPCRRRAATRCGRFLEELTHVWLFEVSPRVHNALSTRGIDRLQSRRARVAHESARLLVSDPAALDAR